MLACDVESKINFDNHIYDFDNHNYLPYSMYSPRCRVGWVVTIASLQIARACIVHVHKYDNMLLYYIYIMLRVNTQTTHLEIALPSWACLDEEKIIPVVTTTDATAKTMTNTQRSSASSKLL